MTTKCAYLHVKPSLTFFMCTRSGRLFSFKCTDSLFKPTISVGKCLMLRLNSTFCLPCASPGALFDRDIEHRTDHSNASCSIKQTAIILNVPQLQYDKKSTYFLTVHGSIFNQLISVYVCRQICFDQ